MSPTTDPGRRVRRVPPVDQLERDDERLVLVAGRAVRVSGLGPAVLDATTEATTLAALTDHLVEEYGAPAGADPAVVVAQVVEALVAEGLLEQLS